MNGDTLDATARQCIARYSMIDAGDGIVVGVSGGPDSVALLLFLLDIAPDLDLRLHIAHVNHMIRGADADADTDYVQELGRSLGVPVTVRRVDVPKAARVMGATVEDAGRSARYGLFRQTAKALGFAKVAVGHNADDQAETVIMRVVRGTGIRGLAGIPPTRDLGEGITLIRPLIDTTRTAIEASAKARASLTPDSVYLVDEDDARRVALRLIEHVTNPACANTHKHLHKVRATHAEERNISFSGNSLGKKRFARSRRTDEEYAAGYPRSKFNIAFGMLEIVDNLLKLIHNFVYSGDILERNSSPLSRVQLRSALAELHRPVAPTLNLIHDEEENNKEKHYRYYVGDESDPPCPLPFRHHRQLYLIRKIRIPAQVFHKALHVGIVQLESRPVIKRSPD
jgi:tRNA(Ile)-lysidine synthetase-like protein